MLIVENKNKFKMNNNLSSFKNCFSIVFEGIKIVSTVDCVLGFVPKCWTNVRERKLTVVSFAKGHFDFWNLTLNCVLLFVATSKTSLN